MPKKAALVMRCHLDTWCDRLLGAAHLEVASTTEHAVPVVLVRHRLARPVPG